MTLQSIKAAFVGIFPQWSHEGQRRVQRILDVISYVPDEVLKGECKYQGLSIRLERDSRQQITIVFFHPDGEDAAATWSRPVLALLNKHIGFRFEKVIFVRKGYGENGMFDQCFPFPKLTWILFDCDGTPLICVGSARSARSAYGGRIYDPTCSSAHYEEDEKSTLDDRETIIGDDLSQEYYMGRKSIA